MKKKLKEGLIVSCQALKGEPLYGGDTVVKLAKAAVLGGAVGIRANSVKDIKAIKRITDVPVIGLIKKVYPDSEIYISPKLNEIKQLIKSKCDVIALDATKRPRPGNEKLEDLVTFIRKNSDAYIMADISDIEEARRAEQLGFDYISSTLYGYTAETKDKAIPDLAFLEELKAIKNSCIIAEGGINSRILLEQILELGYKTVIIGGAITRPMQITQYYAESFSKLKRLGYQE